MSKNKSIWHKGDMLFFENNELFNNGKGEMVSNNDRLRLYYTGLALTRFKWENLPFNIKSRNIEEFLFKSGMVCFFKDEVYGYVCLPCTPSGEVNIYGEPQSYEVHGVGYDKTVSRDECVIIRANDLAIPDSIHLEHYIYINAMIEKTQLINLVTMRTPSIIGTNKETEFSIKQICKKIYDEFEPQVYVDKSIENDLTQGTKVFNTQTPYNIDKLQQFKYEKEAELFTFLGINNNNNRKKERLLVDEVNSNNGLILMSLETSYKNRKKAVDKINEKFGLNIEVIKTMKELDESEVNQNMNSLGGGNDEPFRK